MADRSFEQLTSRGLAIRRLAAADAEALASYRSDLEVARYQDWVCPYPVSEARQFIASVHHLAPGTPGTWFQLAVSLTPSGPLIGDVALRVWFKGAWATDVLYAQLESEWQPLSE